jgi:hypothetical protein
MTTPQNNPTRDELLKLIPPNAVRVKVQDELGHEKWRSIENGFDGILDTDTLVVLSGKPVTMGSSPGRKRKGTSPSTTPRPINHAVAQLSKQKSSHLKNDRLLNKVSQDIEADEILQLVLVEYAKEAASLGFERYEAERQGKETSAISVRRVNALKAIGELFLKRKEQLADRSIDMSSPAFERLFKFIMETFQEAMNSAGLSGDEVQVVITKLSERMSDDTWENEARSKMKG